MPKNENLQYLSPQDALHEFHHKNIPNLEIENSQLYEGRNDYHLSQDFPKNRINKLFTGVIPSSDLLPELNRNKLFNQLQRLEYNANIMEKKRREVMNEIGFLHDVERKLKESKLRIGNDMQQNCVINKTIKEYINELDDLENYLVEKLIEVRENEGQNLTENNELESAEVPYHWAITEEIIPNNASLVTYDFNDNLQNYTLHFPKKRHFVTTKIGDGIENFTYTMPPQVETGKFRDILNSFFFNAYKITEKRNNSKTELDRLNFNNFKSKGSGRTLVNKKIDSDITIKTTEKNYEFTTTPKEIEKQVMELKFITGGKVDLKANLKPNTSSIIIINRPKDEVNPTQVECSPRKANGGQIKVSKQKLSDYMSARMLKKKNNILSTLYNKSLLPSIIKSYTDSLIVNKQDGQNKELPLGNVSGKSLISTFNKPQYLSELLLPFGGKVKNIHKVDEQLVQANDVHGTKLESTEERVHLDSQIPININGSINYKGSDVVFGGTFYLNTFNNSDI